MNLELKKAIDQISKDKGLDRDMLVDTLEDAVRTSVIRKYGENIDVEVSYNDDTGEIQVHQFKIVVDDVADPDTEIDIEKARELDPSVQLDDEIGFPLKVTDLGRIAAQSAKQVIIQRMRDAEQELIYEEFKDRVGEICSGIIQRRDKGGWIINLGRTEAILPKEEQIPREHYKRGDRVQALIIEVKKEGRGPQIVISRSHRDYTAALFRREGRAGHVRERHRLAQGIHQHGQVCLEDLVHQPHAALVEADLVDIQHPGRRFAGFRQGELPVGAAVRQPLQVGGGFGQLDAADDDALAQQRQ